MMGISPESYFKDNSVHDSYFRCYTIHGTSNVTVARNVAFRTTGHCYYLEDVCRTGSSLCKNSEYFLFRESKRTTQSSTIWPLPLISSHLSRLHMRSSWTTCPKHPSVSKARSGSEIKSTLTLPQVIFPPTRPRPDFIFLTRGTLSAATLHQEAGPDLPT